MIKKIKYFFELISIVKRINNTLDSLVLSSNAAAEHPYIELKNGLKFTGQKTKPHFKYFHRLLTKNLKQKVPASMFQILMDIDFRYMPRETNKLNLAEGKYLEIEKGATVFELGAFIGFHAIKLSEIVGNEGRVIAVEAIPENYEILKRNIEINNIKNVTVLNYAIWHSDGTIEMNRDEGQKNSIVDGIVKQNTVLELPSRCVDSLYEEVNVDKLDFVRIQTNGAELDALRGMPKVLGLKPTLLVAVPYKNQIETDEFLKQAGFKTEFTGHSILAKS